MQEPRRDWPSAVCVARIIGAAQRLDAHYTATLFRELWRLPDRGDERMLAPNIAIEHLSLGVRRERARSSKRSVLLPLLVETHPSVVTLLAGNPRLRDLDAVRLMALRPQHPYALWAMLLRPRWLSRPEVLEAIALNPACLPWMLLTIAPLLSSAVLSRALRSGRLTNAVIEATRHLHAGAMIDAVDAALRRARRHHDPIIVEIGADALHASEVALDEAMQAAVALSEAAPSEAAVSEVAATPSTLEPAPQWPALPLTPPPPPLDIAEVASLEP